MPLDKFQQVESAEDADDLLLMCDDDSVYLVVPHDTGRGADVVIFRDRVDLFTHDRANRRTVFEFTDQIGGGHDANGVSIAVHNGYCAYVVFVENLANRADALVWLGGDDGFRHQFIYLDVHRFYIVVEDELIVDVGFGQELM